MQVVVSISFATVGADRTPVAGEALAEILLISMLLGMCHISSENVAQPAEVALFDTQAISKEMPAFSTRASRRARALINRSFNTPRNLGPLALLSPTSFIVSHPSERDIKAPFLRLSPN
jgi:hypothetical protein